MIVRRAILALSFSVLTLCVSCESVGQALGLASSGVDAYDRHESHTLQQRERHARAIDQNGITDAVLEELASKIANDFAADVSEIEVVKNSPTQLVLGFGKVDIQDQIVGARSGASTKTALKNALRGRRQVTDNLFLPEKIESLDVTTSDIFGEDVGRGFTKEQILALMIEVKREHDLDRELTDYTVNCRVVHVSGEQQVFSSKAQATYLWN